MSNQGQRCLIEALESRRLLSAGDQDMTFGVNGVVPVSETLQAGPTSLLPAGGDKTYVVGVNYIAKHNADGSLDTSFGTAGIAGPAPDIIKAKLQADGKVLVLGLGPSGSYYLSRYTTSGQLDSTFGTGGQVGISSLVPGSASAGEFALQSDGKIIIRIETFIGAPLGHAGLYRLNTNGTLDGTFHVFSYDLQYRPSSLQPLAIDANNRIYFAGVYLSYGGTSFNLVRLNADGTIDTSFASDGLFTQHGVDEIQPLASGKILITDSTSNEGYADYGNMRIWRLNADGTFDDTFGQSVVDQNHGTLVTFGGYGGGVEITLLSDGRILLHNSVDICRLSADGVFDASFGGVISMYSSGAMTMYGLVEQSDGRLMVVGNYGLQRLQGDADMTPGPVHLDENGTLTIAGTDGDDLITFDGNSQDLHVRVRGRFGRMYNPYDVKFVSADLGAGNDGLFLWDALCAATVSGGDGNDTIYGSMSHDDSISGNAQNDVICGRGGNDRLAGNGGRDRILGNYGDDRIYGGAGSDWLYGESDNDQIWGEGGNDRISGGAGGDTLRGGAGADTILTSLDLEIDWIYGDGGHDYAVCDADDLWSSIEELMH